MLFGAVDLGSNSFRVEVGRVENGRIITEGYWKETLRLASGLDADRNLTAAMQETALECLRRFHDILAAYELTGVRAVATQTLRVAKNADSFLERAEEALGYPIEVIAGREEARLVFAGCSHCLPVSKEKRLVVDIGGASTELAVGTGLVPRASDSFHIGCVNTTLAFFPNGEITAEAMKTAIVWAKSELEDATKVFHPRGWDASYGSSGTVGALALVATTMGLTNGVVTPALLKRLREIMIEAGSVDKLVLPGLPPDRLPVIAGGLAILTAVFEMFHIKEMRPAMGALRAGILYDLLERYSQNDVRDATVTSLLRRINVDRQQAARVAALADRFFLALNATVPSTTDRKILQWTAMLHETGRLISTSGYHKHTHYIISNADLSGFSRNDQRHMAVLALAQRGNLKKVQDELGDASRRRMICALRLAIIFAHARTTLRLPSFSFTTRGTSVTLTLPAEWLEKHSQTEFLLQSESQIWQRVGCSFTLQRV